MPLFWGWVETSGARQDESPLCRLCVHPIERVTLCWSEHRLLVLTVDLNAHVDRDDGAHAAHHQWRALPLDWASNRSVLAPA
jgi:hypothetical protein